MKFSERAQPTQLSQKDSTAHRESRLLQDMQGENLESVLAAQRQNLERCLGTSNIDDLPMIIAKSNSKCANEKRSFGD